MEITTIIGYSAAVFMIFGYLPQTIHTIRTRSTDDIAIGTFLLLGIGSICFMIQGYMLDNYPLAITNTLTTVMSAIIFVIKIKNDRLKKKKLLSFRKKKQKSQEEDLKNSNSKNTNIVVQKKSKLTSLSLFLSISAILLSGGCIVALIVTPATDKALTESVVSLVAVCATLIVGVQIFNSVEYRHAIDKVEKKHDDAINQIKSLQNDKEETINELKKTNIQTIRSDGDASRMVAYLLLTTDKPTWAIGWTCRAMKRYSECFKADKDSNVLSPSYVDLKNQCIPIVGLCIRRFVEMVVDKKKTIASTKEVIIEIVNDDNHEKKKLVLIRAFKDLVDYRIMENKKDSIFEETLEQEELISTYISLIQKTLTPKDLKECERISWFRNEDGRFTEELSKHKRDDSVSIDNLFDELKKMC